MIKGIDYLEVVKVVTWLWFLAQPLTPLNEECIEDFSPSGMYSRCKDDWLKFPSRVELPIRHVC